MLAKVWYGINNTFNKPPVLYILSIFDGIFNRENISKCNRHKTIIEITNILLFYFYMFLICSILICPSGYAVSSAYISHSLFSFGKKGMVDSKSIRFFVL